MCSSGKLGHFKGLKRLSAREQPFAYTHGTTKKKFDILLVLVLDITHNLNKAIIQDLDGKEKSLPFESVH